MKPDKIQIVNLSLPPAQLREIVETLAQEGHLCLVSEAIETVAEALSQPSTKLLLVGAVDVDLPRLLATIRAADGHISSIPVLVCYAQPPSSNYESLFASEIDDFLLPPLRLSDVRLRVQRLMQQQDKKVNTGATSQARKRPVANIGMPHLIGRSEAFVAVKEKIPRVAAYDATVLITGETGNRQGIVRPRNSLFQPSSLRSHCSC
jgi:DNA-binding NtrC family response regulator